MDNIYLVAKEDRGLTVRMDIQDTIHGLFEKQVVHTPDKVAVVCEGQTVTYQEVNERANQLAHYLLASGVKLEAHVAICMERSVDLLSVILGILKAGGNYVPLDPLHPEARILFTLEDNNSPLVVTTSDLKDKFAQYTGQLIVLEHDEQHISTQPNHNPDTSTTPQHLAYIIYTSGSTGKPKGTLIEHRGVVNYCRWFSDYCDCKSQQSIDFSSNYIFDMAITTSIIPLMQGLTLVICNDETKKGVRQYLKFLEQNKIHIIKVTPSYFKVLLHEVKSNPIELPHLKSIILGGENLLTADCISWLAIYPDHVLFNEYGPTEATVAVSEFKISYKEVATLGASIPIGKPGPNMYCYILSAENIPTPAGETGELHIGGVCLARGYLNQAELTEKKFIKDPFSSDKNARLYKTGDLCRQLPDGMIEYIGRVDNQVKIRGFRVELGEIEQCLAKHSVIKDVVVLAHQDELDNKLIAYYIPNDPNTAPNVNDIQQFSKANLPDYMIPTAFVRINAFPLTANGKLDKQALPIPRFTTNQHYHAPTTDLEKTLAEIWSEGLGLKLIGTEDNFFELGGHSLSAARIISKINSTLGKDITLREFYEAPTIKKLLTVIYDEKKINEKSIISNTNAYDENSLLPLSDFQLLLWLSNTFEPKAKKMNIFARKRMHGHLDNAALVFAFNAVFKKHEIFSYQVLRFRPAQRLQKNLPFEVTEKNLASLTLAESESILDNSAKELINHFPWAKDKPMIIAKLFHLKDDETELQISMPHIISDDISPDILFSDLSAFYLLYKQSLSMDAITPDRGYIDYQFNEQQYAKARKTKDILFWENYLSDACLFPFPPEHVIKDMSSESISYSTYTEIPEQRLKNLQQFCAENYVSISDGLCAALGLALVNCCNNFGDEAKNILMDIVKSTRGNQMYDNTIGCFLNLEPIKVTLSTQSDLIGLSKQIHRSTIHTAPYQRCSSIVKLACISTLRQNKNIIKRYLIATLIYLYTKLIPTPNLDRETLNLCERLITLKKTNNFMVNVNVHKSFVSGIKRPKLTELFGLKPKKIKNKQPDLLEIDRVIEVCMLRDDYRNTPYIVISANLAPSFRELIAKEMIRIIHLQTVGDGTGVISNIGRVATTQVDNAAKVDMSVLANK